MKKWKGVIHAALDVAPILTLQIAKQVFPDAGIYGSADREGLILKRQGNLPLTEAENEQVWQAIDKSLPPIGTR